MKKHIFGLAIFSFIVGTAAVFAVVFSYVPTIPIIGEAEEPAMQSETFNWCRQDAEVKVSQALINKNNQKLDLSFLVKREDVSVEPIEVILWFYAQDNKKIRYLTHKVIAIKSNYSSSNIADYLATISYEKLGDLKPNENLYVLSEIAPCDAHRFVPTFDKNKAVPVVAAELK